MVSSQPSIVVVDQHPRLSDFRQEVLEGLRRPQKALPAKLFYDERGSDLFLDITRLEEYYPTRTEIEILRSNAREMTAGWREGFALVELGSGSSEKVRILLDHVGIPITYMPIDISRAHLEESAQSIARGYPHIQVVAVCSDYTTGLDIPDWDRYDRRVLFFPGSTIGNFEPFEAKGFLRQLAVRLAPRDGMIIGVDLKKDTSVLEDAYNDRRGVTAQFNLNLLRRINRDLSADFDGDRFEHCAFYNEPRGRIEMHLRSTADQTVTIGNERFSFVQGETIHTENSYKYGPGEFREMVHGTGFSVVRTWTDPARMFSVQCLEVESSPMTDPRPGTSGEVASSEGS